VIFVFNKKDFIKQTEKAIQEYSENNIEEQSLLKALANFDLYQKQFNTFFEYLKDWFSLHNSNLYDKLNKDNYKFVKFISETEIKDLEKEVYLSKGLDKEDLLQIKNLSITLISIYSNISKIENFFTKKVKIMYPNLTNILGPILTVRFLNQAHSLQRLSSLPSSTLQLFGAETAMFKHLKFGKASPKYGLLYLHPLMSGLNANQKGKLARYMANKIALASRMDLLKKPLHKELLEDIENKKTSILLEKEKAKKLLIKKRK
jgi:nucleolar protein 56